MTTSLRAGTNSRLHFGLFGASLNLPDCYSATQAPDWRAVHFSVALPLPYVVDQDLGDDWFQGRFNGIKRIEIGRESQHGAHLERPKLRDNEVFRSETYYKYAPHSFHKQAGHQFQAPFRDSVGANVVDGPAAGHRIDDENTRALRVDAYKYKFAPDITRLDEEGWIPDFAPQARIEHPSSEPEDSLESVWGSEPAQGEGLDIIRLDDDEAHPYSQARLLCSELVTFQDPEHHVSHDSSSENTATTFLILHLVVENCSAAMLEKASQSIAKVRNRVNIVKSDAKRLVIPENKKMHVVRGTHDNDSEQTYSINLLNYFFDLTLSVLPAAERGLKMEKGGYLRRDKWRFKEVTDAKDKELELLQEESDRRQRSGDKVARFTTVCAIPGRDIAEVPMLLGGAPETDEDLPAHQREDIRREMCERDALENGHRWLPSDLWGWQLARGADSYHIGLPALEVAPEKLGRIGLYKNWNIHSSPEGIAVVRRSAISREDPALWMITGTRFMDLALLVARAAKYLSSISNRLREMKFEGLDGVHTETMNLQQLRGASDKLQRQLDRFQDIQRDFVVFRDQLWFETVPGRELYTRVLNAIQDSTGARHLYDDIAGELDIRKEVYTTRFQTLRLQIEGEMGRLQADRDEEAKQRDAAAKQREIEDDKRREDEREAREQEREAERLAREEAKEEEEKKYRRESEERSKANETLNQSLAFVAAILAFPALFDMIPGWSDGGKFVLTVVVVVALIAFWAIRTWMKSHAKSDLADSEPLDKSK
ncbi:MULTISPECIES: hypothetical protein [unclassified Corynebacterium]|uniref:hypothetical protein n=1 Tax=unclassified Corynebacterium TaxID=2624378 RepID=UPI000B1D7DA1|nr:MULTISPECIES: hypothetical protein [unclassified Corynebacterium]